MRSQVQASVAAVAVAVVVAAAWVGRSSGLAAGVVTLGIGAVCGGAFGWWSLRRGRHTPWEMAERHVAPGHAVVLWKPGCVYCERLLRAVGDDEAVTWVNVWHDRAANDAVRRLDGGDEYTPTALVGDVVLRNPTAADLQAVIGDPAAQLR